MDLNIISIKLNKFNLAPPTAPVDPHSQSIGSNFVALSWSKPLSDGGIN